MPTETVQEIIDYCHEMVGENLRTVTRYSAEEFEPVYTRDGIFEQIQLDEETLGMFRNPVFQIHRAAWDVGSYHLLLDVPDVAISSFGDISAIQFPVTREDGILVTLDSQGELPTGLVSHCKSIVYTSP